MSYYLSPTQDESNDGRDTVPTVKQDVDYIEALKLGYSAKEIQIHIDKYQQNPLPFGQVPTFPVDVLKMDVECSAGEIRVTLYGAEPGTRPTIVAAIAKALLEQWPSHTPLVGLKPL